MMELKILYIREYIDFYYLYLNKMVNDILVKQTKQKEKKHAILFSLSIQHSPFYLPFPKKDRTNLN